MDLGKSFLAFFVSLFTLIICRTCGIVPVDATPLLKKLPSALVAKEVTQRQVGEALIDFLTPPAEDKLVKKRKKAVKVSPGKAVTCEEVLFLQHLEKREKEEAKQILLIEKAAKAEERKEKQEEKKRNQERTKKHQKEGKEKASQEEFTPAMKKSVAKKMTKKS